MSDPSLALQGALLAALRAANTAAGASVFDSVPGSDPFPRITIGEGQTLSNRADCYDGSESFVEINVWSRANGYPEAKRIASDVRTLLDGADGPDGLPIDGHRLELFEFQDAVPLRDPDGKTRRIRMTFRALTQALDESGSG